MAALRDGQPLCGRRPDARARHDLRPVGPRGRLSPGPFSVLLHAPDLAARIGNVGAYGRAISGDFNGYGKYDEAILDDEPIMSMYGGATSGARTAEG